MAFRGLDIVCEAIPNVLLAAVVVTALAFDFLNGFHDAGNAMARSIATGPAGRGGVLGSAQSGRCIPVLSVAATIASGLVETNLVTLTEVFAGLAGGITWNLLT